MAINYSEVGWNSGSYIGPTNFNHMDEGIKAACDQADTNAAGIIALNESLAKIGYSFTSLKAGIAGVADALNTNYSLFPTNTSMCGTVSASNARYQFIGFKNSVNFATFLVQSYLSGAVYHLRFRDGTTWSFELVSVGTETDITL